LLAYFFAGAATRLGGEQSAMATAALLFGTPLFAYGLLNFAHALTAMTLFTAWMLLFVTPSPRNDVLAGAAIGIAVLSEYPAAIPAAVIVAFAIGSRSIPRIIAGGAPFALALALYNRALFGSVFALSSGFERDPAFRELAKRGLFGISVPDPVNLMRLLVDPSRGLFVFSPILLAGLTALPAMRRKLTPRQFWSLLAVPASIVLMFAGYPNWHGGWTVGSRYLVPALPFLAMLIAFTRASWLTALLAGASALAIVLTSIVFPFIPPEIPAPWGTFAWPMLREGLIAPNLFHFAARPLAIAIPLLVCALAVLAVTKPRVAVVAGALLWMAAALVMPLHPVVRIQRAFIEEVSFERNGAIAKTGASIPALEQRARNARRLPPPDWPF
jgi:hypothetical protein